MLTYDYVSVFGNRSQSKVVTSALGVIGQFGKSRHPKPRGPGVTKRAS